jgi:hypothetical protein
VSRQRSKAHGKAPTHDNAARRTANKGGPIEGGDARQRRCRAVLRKRTVKKPLPGIALPCALCRAATHGNDFVVPSGAFAVRLARMAKPAIPVVSVSGAMCRSIGRSSCVLLLRWSSSAMYLYERALSSYG